MANTDKNINSDFEYKSEYWYDAQKLIKKEESHRNRLRAAIYAVAAVGLIVGVVLFFPSNVVEDRAIETASITEGIDKTVVKGVITPVDLSVKNKSANENELVKETKEYSLVNTASSDIYGNVSSGKTNSISNVVATEQSGNLALIDSPKLTNLSNTSVSSGTANPQIETLLNDKKIVDNHKNNDFAEYSKVIISPILVDLSLNKLNFTLSKLLHEPPKKRRMNKEVFFSGMAHPGYTQGEKEVSMQISYNAGILLGKSIGRNLVLAGGLQYNSYKSMHQFKDQESFDVVDPDRLINSYTVIDDEEWVIVDATENTISDVSVNTVTGSGISISTVNLTGIASSETVPNNLVSNTMNSITDTLLIPTVQDEVFVRGDRHVREKTVLVGSILLPLELQYAMSRLRLTGGISFEYLIHSKVAVEEWDEVASWTTREESTVLNNNFKRLNRTMFNATLGIDYFLIDQVSVGLKGSAGLSDLTNDSQFESFSFDRNSNLSFSIRYHWN
jgi:hypothetical protein